MVLKLRSRFEGKLGDASEKRAVWALPLKLSSLNSAIYGAVVPERRQGFVSVLSVV
ncbi:unnamed protein product, partial [Rangifer tarandus platyrhynchus]